MGDSRLLMRQAYKWESVKNAVDDRIGKPEVGHVRKLHMHNRLWIEKIRHMDNNSNDDEIRIEHVVRSDVVDAAMNFNIKAKQEGGDLIVAVQTCVLVTVGLTKWLNTYYWLTGP